MSISLVALSMVPALFSTCCAVRDADNTLLEARSDNGPELRFLPAPGITRSLNGEVLQVAISVPVQVDREPIKVALLTGADEVKDMQGTGNNGQEAAELEWELFMDNLHLPGGDGEKSQSPSDDSPVVAYAFAIGSIFNDESRRSSKLKEDVFTKALLMGGKKDPDNPESLNDRVIEKLETSGPDCPEYASITSGFERMWTYPSGGNNRFWAVSLHRNHHHDGAVLGMLVKNVDKEWFTMMRPREEDYDVLSIDPEDIVLHTGETLRQRHPHEKVFAFAYGYNSRPNAITHIFEEEERLKRYRDYNASLQVVTEGLCNAWPVVPDGKGDLAQAKCKTNLRKARGHVLAQSYIDVIIAGILEMGQVSTVSKYKVWGGLSTAGIKDVYRENIVLAEQFVQTTTWPVELVEDERILYINDRKCPRNGNPMYTPQALLSAPHLAGTSSSAPDTEHLYELIDDIMKQATQGQALLAYRKGNDQQELDEICKALPRLPRWTDQALSRGDSLWDVAYNREEYQRHQKDAIWEACKEMPD